MKKIKRARIKNGQMSHESNCSIPEQQQRAAMTRIDLLPCERIPFLFHAPPVATVTFFELPSTSQIEQKQRGLTRSKKRKRRNFALPPAATSGGKKGHDNCLEAMIDHFQHRVDGILEANPWLRSVLKYDAKGLMAAYCYNDTALDDKTYFQVRSDVDLQYPACLENYDEMNNTLSPTLCKPSSHSINKSLPLWQVTLVPCTRTSARNMNRRDTTTNTAGSLDNNASGGRGGNFVALVVSGNHCFLDGYSFYRLYNMLSSDVPIESLNAIRKQELPEKIKKKLNDEVTIMEEQRVLWVMTMLGKQVLTTRFFPEALTQVFYVDERWIQDQKVEASKLTATSREDAHVSPFVSTNDLLSSEILKSMECDEAYMAVNFRNRVENCHNKDVGNYENVILYMPQDYDTPQLIRKSLTGKYYLRASTPTTKRLSKWSNGKVGIVTNWSKFPVELKIGDARHGTCGNEVLHMPLYHCVGEPMSMMNTAVIFRPSANKTAVIFMGDRRSVAKMKSSALVKTPYISASTHAV